MDIESYIDEAIFSENEKQKFLCRLFWDDLKETGYVITDESGHELDSIVKAVSIVNLIGEFRYRLYDEVNETGYEDVLEYLANLDIYEDEILDYCRKNENIETDEEFSNTAKNMLDYITETTADKLLEEFSADDIFGHFKAPPIFTSFVWLLLSSYTNYHSTNRTNYHHDGLQDCNYCEANLLYMQLFFYNP